MEILVTDGSVFFLTGPRTTWLYRPGWARQQVLDLFAVLAWMMRLPYSLKQLRWQDIDEIDQEKRMAFITTYEERGIEKGFVLGEVALLERLLTRRFGPLPEEVCALLKAGSREQLQVWGDRVLDASSLAEIFGGH